MRSDELRWLTDRPIAHRGLHDSNQVCWENTLSAFDRAIAGQYGIECDVTFTADNVPVVFHDHELERLTGREGSVRASTASQMTNLPVGGTSDRVPGLAEVLRLVDGRVPIVIELKGKEGRDDGFVEAVGEALRGYSGNAAVMSFDHHLVRQFNRIMPDVPAGLTAAGSDEAAIEAHFSMLAHGISFVSYEVEAIPNRFVAMTRDRLGMPFITWTVRDNEAAQRTWSEGGQITFEGFVPDAST